MSGFAIDWLDLRADADQRARDTGLMRRAQQWLARYPTGDSAPLVVDLGAGTGATLRAFSNADFAADSWRWRLLDNDPLLLAEARRRHGNSYALETVSADLAKVSTLPLADACLVTASALFDLVSAAFIKELAGALQSLQHASPQRPIGLYAALNYDGVTRWTPAHPLDDAVLAAFNRDQRSDKGFGPALGPEAGVYMEHAFNLDGFTVYSASSPWQLDGADQALSSALIDGIASAVASQLNPQALAGWVAFRHNKVASGTCTVGHTDLLALPELAQGA